MLCLEKDEQSLLRKMNTANQLYTSKKSLEKMKGRVTDEFVNEFLKEIIGESLAMVSSNHQLMTNVDWDKRQQQYEQDRSKEADSTNFMVALASTKEELNKGTHAKTCQTIGNISNGSEHFDFTSSGSETDNDMKDIEQDADYQLSDKCLATSEDGRLSSQLTPRNDPGESSFSMLTQSNNIAPAGSIPYCRTTSDGSTTSAHSFVFPILHSDWNNSPMKIIQTDKRHDIVIKKHRSRWRCLLCCAF